MAVLRLITDGNQLAKKIVDIAIRYGVVLGQAFARAVRQEYAASQQAAQRAGGGQRGKKTVVSDSVTGISLQEAKEILNVSDINDVEAVQKNYDHLFKMNEKTNGGSFYLQSKVFRAKERIDLEIKSQSQSSESETNKQPPET